MASPIHPDVPLIQSRRLHNFRITDPWHESTYHIHIANWVSSLLSTLLHNSWFHMGIILRWIYILPHRMIRLNQILDTWMVFTQQMPYRYGVLIPDGSQLDYQLVTIHVHVGQIRENWLNYTICNFSCIAMAVILGLLLKVTSKYNGQCLFCPQGIYMVKRGALPSTCFHLLPIYERPPRGSSPAPVNEILNEAHVLQEDLGHLLEVLIKTCAGYQLYYQLGSWVSWDWPRHDCGGLEDRRRRRETSRFNENWHLMRTMSRQLSIKTWSHQGSHLPFLGEALSWPVVEGNLWGTYRQAAGDSCLFIKLAPMGCMSMFIANVVFTMVLWPMVEWVQCHDIGCTEGHWRPDGQTNLCIQQTCTPLLMSSSMAWIHSVEVTQSYAIGVISCVSVRQNWISVDLSPN